MGGEKGDIGKIERLPLTSVACFRWDYEATRSRLLNLYENSKNNQWNATEDIDWSTEIDPGRAVADRQFRRTGGEFESRATRAFAKASEENRWLLKAHSHAWTVSQFLHGEQGALVAAAKICAGVDSIDNKLCAAAQVADEARHVEAYKRYLEKIDIAYPVAPSLRQLLNDVVSHPDVDVTFVGMQILVEGVALAAFSLGGAMFENPVIKQITALVRRDEARHVAFGVVSLEGFYKHMDPSDLAEREDFILEACSLMQDRFIPSEVYERLGIDSERAASEFKSGPDVAAFRRLMFSKIVPNLGKLGLLTPKVREGFSKLGILRYQRYLDSASEAEESGPYEERGEDPIIEFRSGLVGVSQITVEPVLGVVASTADTSVLATIEPCCIRLEVGGIEDGDWTIVLAPTGMTYARARKGDQLDVSIRMDVATWTDIIAGRITAPAAAVDGRIVIVGDIMKALSFEALL